MNASSSGVARLAAKMMSPSFSRFSSSTTRTGRPAAMSLTARSTSSKISVTGDLPGEQPLHVFGDHVDLQVHGVTGLSRAQGGALERLGDQADLEPLVRGVRRADRGDG